MSHVDEGALHAYLDGALDEYPAAEAERIREHLDGCAECAARLEGERGLRQDVSAILGLAVPDVEAPSFEDLKAYVRATRPAPSPSALRLYRLGWAASMVAALGVGWLVGDGRLDRSSPPGPAGAAVPRGAIGETDREVAAAAPLGRSEREAARAARLDLDASTTGATAPSSPDVVATRQAMQGFAAEESAAEARLAPVPGEQVAAGGAEPGVVPAVGRFADSDPAQPSVGSQGTVAPADLTELLQPTARSLARSAPGAAATLSGVPADPPAETTSAAASSDSAAGRLRERMEQRSRDVGARAAVEAAQPRAPGLEPDRVAGTDLGAEPAAAEADGDADDEAPLSVPGVEVLSIKGLGEGTPRTGVHIEQRLDGGVRIDVYHLTVGVDPSVLPPLQPGRNEARVEREQGWIVLRGAVAPETLRALLARLVPEG